MKTQHELELEILRIESKLEDAKLKGYGYNSYSELRADETRVNLLKWVLDLPVASRPRIK